jgi:hypothetical protein
MMAWLSRTKKDCTDAEDEAGVGLISPKSESAATNRTRRLHLQVYRIVLSVALVLSNIAWASICLMLWRGTSRSSCVAQTSHNGFEADFGTLTLKTGCTGIGLC